MEDFKLIARFLEETDTEVGGHAAAPLTARQEAGLRSLAAGTADARSTSELETLLAENETAMDFFSRLLTGGASPGEDSV